MAKILVVDDTETDRVLSSSILRKAGHTVIEAVNGQDGLEKVKLHKPDAVIMDIVMPILDGFGALKRLIQSPETKSIKVIIVSSKPQESDKFRANFLGAKGYVVKPVTADKLLPVLNQVLL